MPDGHDARVLAADLMILTERTSKGSGMALRRANQIAREIGVSRNAVIGKANRLGLSRTRTGARNIARSRIATQHRTLLALWAKPQLAPAEAPGNSANCCSYPNCYIRVVAFDNIKQCQVMSFTVHKPNK